MRLILSLAALFLSIILLQLASGGVGPLDALTGLEEGFSKGQIGVLGSSHFFGFFIGCWWAPRVMGTVGHSRAFAVFSSMGAIGMLGHTLLVDPMAWAIMRIASGICVAGCYTVIEAWLQAKATNQNRGRTMGVYRFVDISASLGAQMMIGALATVETYLAYNLLTLFFCASLLPLALTKASPPVTKSAPRLRPLLALSRSPLAVSAVIVAGLTSAAYRMVGPIYGSELGMNASQIGLFLAGYVAGGAISQYPSGWLADKFDRRWVIIGFSVVSLAACAISLFAATLGQVIIASCLFGFITVPIYSVATAHAHDFAASDERVELSAALLFYFATGAIVSPIAASLLIQKFGTESFFIFIATAHLVLATVGGLRMIKGGIADAKTPYVYSPRTSFLIGRLTKRLRDPDTSKKP
ncbi:MAG: MFS transporter [Planktomarina sp.]|nr:MFS transporter [Planktomarina sp.]MDT2033928.1 MFS transporter [Planktomarina sp.]MDT2040307.1 MFS transporter [Planktomarina sp.]MDT2050110.1 MFS transporter [Planktomarina sp.]|tara:strand:- start:2985 stop:4220 length:1236 start_codon:yes stop_codon:yes gene_type:complete